MRPKRTISMRSRPVSAPLSVSENSPTAAWPLRSSGTAHKPKARRALTPSRPTSRPASVIASGLAASVSPLIALKSSFCPLPATPATPKISPALTLSATSCSATPNSLGFGRLRPSAASLGAPKLRLAGLAISLRFAPIIISAIEREVSRFGSQCATTLPPRRMVAVSHKRHDLVQLVRDVEDRAAARRELSQSLEQLLDFLRRQHRGRLVHDQQPRIEQERAHDLDALALADAERRDDAARIELEPIGLEHPIELGQKLARGEARIEAERDILEHRHRLEQREMLEHHADAQPPRRARIGDADGRAVEDDLPLVGREDAVDHLDQRRFSGAVLAEQRMDFAGLDAQVNVVVGAHARKGLADADKFEPRRSFDVHLNLTSLHSPGHRGA